MWKQFPSILHKKDSEYNDLQFNSCLWDQVHQNILFSDTVTKVQVLLVFHYYYFCEGFVPLKEKKESL